MYRQLRLRLTLWYVLLSAITFMTLALVGTALCYHTVTLSLNQEIESLLAQAVSAVDEGNGDQAPKFMVPSETLKTEWSHARATVQLFNTRGKLVAEYGLNPSHRELEMTDYSEKVVDGRRLRMGSDPLLKDGKLIGYLQVETPTDLRDKAVLSYAITMAWLSPLLILGLGVSGYLFSAKASRPVEQAFTLLRRFLADAGHELRTPLHLIQLTAENAMIGHEHDDELQQDLNTIVRATDRMGRLVEDMMTLAKMEVKQLDTKTVPVRFDELLSDVISEYTIRAKEKNITLEGDGFPEVTVLGDGDQLYRMAANLVENAIRYTDSGGTVELSLVVVEAGNLAQFSVRDTGVGIPAESLPLIFDRFYRVDKSRSRAAGGTGLGLAIVKAICDIHRARIEVESHEGHGTTFTVSIAQAASTQLVSQTAVAVPSSKPEKTLP